MTKTNRFIQATLTAACLLSVAAAETTKVWHGGKVILEYETAREANIYLTDSVSITAKVTQGPEPTPDPTPDPEPEPTPARDFLWISPQRLASLPASGIAWERLVKEAGRNKGSPNMSAKDDSRRPALFARALVAARLNDESRKQTVRKEIIGSIGTEGKEIHSLGPTRGLLSVVLAADLVGLSDSDDAKFRDWLEHMRTRRFNGDTRRTLTEVTEIKCNNFGSHGLMARTAVALYLDDQQAIAACNALFRAWCGEFVWSKFEPNSRAFNWTTASKDNFSPINRKGEKKNGFDIGGCISDDQRRSGDGKFRMPNPYDDKSNYPFTALQGLVAVAELLHNAGYPAWDYGDKAIRRAFEFLYQPAVDWDLPKDDSDIWMTPLVNKRTGSNFPENPDIDGGKAIGFAAWSYQ